MKKTKKNLSESNNNILTNILLKIVFDVSFIILKIKSTTSLNKLIKIFRKQFLPQKKETKYINYTSQKAKILLAI